MNYLIGLLIAFFLLCALGIGVAWNDARQAQRVRTTVPVVVLR